MFECCASVYDWICLLASFLFNNVLKSSCWRIKYFSWYHIYLFLNCTLWKKLLSYDSFYLCVKFIFILYSDGFFILYKLFCFSLYLFYCCYCIIIINCSVSSVFFSVSFSHYLHSTILVPWLTWSLALHKSILHLTYRFIFLQWHYNNNNNNQYKQKLNNGILHFRCW